MSGNDNPARDLDVVIFSGHKIYAPGSPGAVVSRTDLFEGVEPQEVGGGMVDDVYVNRYMVTDSFPDREEAGTPNITGAIGLAASLYALQKVGMAAIAEEEDAIIRYAIDRLSRIPEVIIYGETDCDACKRAGAVSFNVRDVDHAMAAAVLNDYFNIAVRNQCFCAHPYVREMITEVLSEESDDLSDEEIERLADLHRGMVRASFGIYNNKADVDILIGAVQDLVDNRERYEQQYDRLERGDYAHKTFKFDHTRLFSVKGAVDGWLADA
jgi:selenocysteine lyase/cysteine desulfurase